MPRTILCGAVVVLIWVIWCVLVVTEFVPQLRRHVLMWPWLMAYVLCLAPVILLGIIAVMRVRQKT